MLNQVFLNGRIAGEVKSNITQGGTAYNYFTLAVPRDFKNKNGEIETDFINVQMWGKTSDNFKKLTAKGSLVGLRGSLRTSVYEKNGEKIYEMKFVADGFDLLESKDQTQARRNN
ncbi:MAG: single-stranded DNA-binding protein [Streptococcaceae bacterium]|jgi:single-strand DNA-binding protein|nr:single-stranded DNA-binding protein [Streptococcaceae bacterium]